MNYEEATEAVVSKSQARREIARHSCDWYEFIADCGERDTYTGAEVLGWLGY